MDPFQETFVSRGIHPTPQEAPTLIVTPTLQKLAIKNTKCHSVRQPLAGPLAKAPSKHFLSTNAMPLKLFGLYSHQK
jgi:hypothetical protein